MTFVVGLTGGIGAGKTTATNYLETLSIPVIDTDLIARTLVAPNSECLALIATHFGNSILKPDGSLDRKKLRKIILQNSSKKKWLESLLHPKIHKMVLNEINAVKAPIVVVVIPLLHENYEKYKNILEQVILIESPEELQISRVKERDNVTENDVLKIIQSQANAQNRHKIADIVINNQNTKESLYKQLLDWHNNLKRTLGTNSD